MMFHYFPIEQNKRNSYRNRQLFPLGSGIPTKGQVMGTGSQGYSQLKTKKGGGPNKGLVAKANVVCLLCCQARDGRFGSKVGQIGPIWDKSGAF